MKRNILLLSTILSLGLFIWVLGLFFAPQQCLSVAGVKSLITLESGNVTFVPRCSLTSAFENYNLQKKMSPSTKSLLKRLNALKALEPVLGKAQASLSVFVSSRSFDFYKFKGNTLYINQGQAEVVGVLETLVLYDLLRKQYPRRDDDNLKAKALFLGNLLNPKKLSSPFSWRINMAVEKFRESYIRSGLAQRMHSLRGLLSEDLVLVKTRAYPMGWVRFEDVSHMVYFDNLNRRHLLNLNQKFKSQDIFAKLNQRFNQRYQKRNHYQQMVWIGCQVPKLQDLSRYSQKVKTINFIKVCSLRDLVLTDWSNMFRQNVDYFISKNKKLSLVRFKLSGNPEELRTVELQASNLVSFASALGWKSLRWDSRLNVYRPQGRSNLVKFFRVIN